MQASCLHPHQHTFRAPPPHTHALHRLPATKNSRPALTTYDHALPAANRTRLPAARKREAKAAELEFALPAKSRKTAGGMSVMDLDTAGFYRPRTKETR
mgnify:CR=1 FL=1